MVCPGQQDEEFEEPEDPSGLAGVLRPVAIVDDDDAVRASLMFALKAEGYVAEGFASPAEFLETDISRFACIILDQRMPGMTGLQLAAQLRRTRRLLPIMLISGELSNDERRRARVLGIERVLDKPLQLSDLVEFVRIPARSGS